MRTISSKFITFIRLIKGRKLKYIYGSLRRHIIFCLFKGYYNLQLSKRKGVCSSNGHCCRLTIPWCAHFVHGKCSVYNKQPLFCKIFPIDEKDKELSDCKESCGYYF